MDGVGSVAFVPLVFVVDRDAQFRLAVLHGGPQLARADELSVERLDGPEDVVGVGAGLFIPLDLFLEGRGVVEGCEPAADLGVGQPGRETWQVCGEYGAEAYLLAFENRL